MLATLTSRRFSDKEWVFERKLDGERCLAFRHGARLRLLSRNEKPLNGSYPELVAALSHQKAGDFVVDGEIVAFQGDLTSFGLLQQRMQIADPDKARASGVAVFYYLFDLLYLDGHETTRLGLRERKTLLKQAIRFRDPLRFSLHRDTRGEAYYKEACQKGWEGLIAKRAESRYVSGRSADWLKFKCVNQQEFVIGGYTDPQGKRVGFGALLLGYYKGGQLKYAGKVGTGYDGETLRRLHQQLARLERGTSPFADKDVPQRNVHWVTPALVGEAAFAEWTRGDKLRHPRFLGLRRDKEPGEVVREKPNA
ncbi:MAG TPA: non-homologous end-joining DNA ligase [Terriglobales bacterium]|nr:non-homologous end-joining DNA ligase [Terriglobales bacterium]